ncbi:MAG: M42 family metallopeptidase [bacterium]|nr:M42 family metallopeptidase [bacterium]
MREELGTLAEFSTDGLGSLVCRLPGRVERPRIMLAGHMDEIGFMVTHITPEGYVKFQALGGWWDQVMLAQRVIVKTRKGDLPGIIGSRPPHILSLDDRKKMVEKRDMYIDVGAAGEAEAADVFGLRPGDPVIPESSFRLMANPRLAMAKAWDDRVGCALVVDVMRELAGDHPNTVYGVGTVQEEVGLRGARASVELVKPDVAFALEVAIAGDTPGIKPEEAQGRLGKGPSILVYDGSLIPNRRLRDLAIETAEADGIPYQFAAMAGGGTDAGAIQFHAGGVPSLVLGVPCRYIHSHTGIVHLDDYDNAVRLLVALVRRLDEPTVAGLTAWSDC